MRRSFWIFAATFIALGCAPLPPASAQTFYDKATTLGYSIEQSKIIEKENSFRYDLHIANCPVVLTAGSRDIVRLEFVGDKYRRAARNALGLTSYQNIPHDQLEAAINKHRAEVGC